MAAGVDVESFIEALNHPTRHLALKLASAGTLTGASLARDADISQPTAWRHLKKLEEAGLLRRVPVLPRTDVGLVTDVSQLERSLRDLLVAIHPRGLEEVVFIGENPEDLIAWPGTGGKGSVSANGSGGHSSKGRPRC